MDLVVLIKEASGVLTSFASQSGLPILTPHGWTLVSRCGGSLPAVERLIHRIGRPSRHLILAPGLLTWPAVRAAWRDPEAAAGPVVACGSGTVMDAAKILRLVDAQGGVPTTPCELDVARAPPAPLVCVPTTCGSGSELTPTASLWDGGIKFSLDGPGLRPNHAVYATEMVGPAWDAPAIAAYWDALSHGLESLWSKRANARSVALATRAIEILTSAAGPEAPDWRRLQQGAAASAAAIALTRTGLAHALSYQLTTRSGCPHGIAAGFWAIVIADFMTELRPDLRRRLGEAIGGADAPGVLLAALWRRTGAQHVARLHFEAADIETLDASAVDTVRAGGSIRSAGGDDLAVFQARALALIEGL